MKERWQFFGPPRATTPPHTHQLVRCHDCDGIGCEYCDGRGYFEVCIECGEPMGNARRKWKRYWRART